MGHGRVIPQELQSHRENPGEMFWGNSTMPYPSYLHGSLHGSSGVLALHPSHAIYESKYASHLNLTSNFLNRVCVVGRPKLGVFTIPLTIPFVFRDLQKKNCLGVRRGVGSKLKKLQHEHRPNLELDAAHCFVPEKGERRAPRDVAFLCPVTWLRSLLTHSHFALPLFVSNFRSESGFTEWGYSMGISRVRVRVRSTPWVLGFGRNPTRTVLYAAATAVER